MQSVAQHIIECLQANKVEIIFDIPGAKVDSLFNALKDSDIKLVICRHEQNATFMAQAYGRLTGKPGIALVTSGPGVTNLTTGLLTATTEGDPVIVLGGNVPRSMIYKASHQSAKNMQILQGVTKSSIEVYAKENVAEAIANAFQTSLQPQRGACFISFPQDILSENTHA